MVVAREPPYTMATAAWTLVPIERDGRKKLDFDAGTQKSVAYNNVCNNNSRHGVFLEEGASFNTIISVPPLLSFQHFQLPRVLNPK